MPEVYSSLGDKNLGQTSRISEDKILNRSVIKSDSFKLAEKVLVTLVAGKGTRFGKDPKCIQPVHGLPLAMHSIDSFRRTGNYPVICLVGYRHDDVMTALGPDNTYVLTDNPTGGTAFAAIEAFCVPGLLERNPLIIITMGDRIIPSSVFRRLVKVHEEGEKEADLTFLSAIYEPPKNSGKGRVIRNETGKVLSILEEKDISAEKDPVTRQTLLNLMEGNCPLYAIRAETLFRHLGRLNNNNAQGQYYLTDIIEAISLEDGDIRTVTTSVNEPEYDLLTSDVTQPMDLAMLEGILSSGIGLLVPEEIEVEAAARLIVTGRPVCQAESIIRQLEELITHIKKEKIDFDPDKPIGIGITGGRLRIAFMHPDMARFFGPAWQMPIGAGAREGDEQIVILIQGAQDGRIHLVPLRQQYRENINSLPAGDSIMYPGEDISDLSTYESFGTRMSEALLLSLGYFSEEELEQRRCKNIPLPPPSLWATSNMRRPCALVGNALASMRTLRAGNIGAKIRDNLGIENFRGLKIVSAGNIPQGGFSSSSAVTVATKNSINALFNLGISSDLLVHLACQAEYGTGVRAGSLDQATEQKGIAGQGTLISSNPKDNYRVLGTYPVPYERIKIIFPYSVERDRSSWRWSGGAYAENSQSEFLTTTEVRKMTGKAAEIAAILVQLPIDTDFFKFIEEDLLDDGKLSDDSNSWICRILLQIPLKTGREELRKKVLEKKDWYVKQLIETNHFDPDSASLKADSILNSLFEGWREPVFKRTDKSGRIMEERGVPLRAMVAYLFGEVAKNFFLIHNQDKWIEYVSRSQRGDCSFEIDPGNLPEKREMEIIAAWEKGIAGPELLNMWMEKTGARPADFNRGIYDENLQGTSPLEFHNLEGSGFFRGLALIDLAEAMIKRAFGKDAVAVRVNAAGQGDYFQVHIDRHKADPEEVKNFIRKAFYKRFSIKPDPDFVEIHTGGGASGIRLSSFGLLPLLIENLKRPQVLNPSNH
ncbi:MAG: NTP transferase domain-containing protein [Bacteroidetes bacterium]|nr:NTP transferase domain-containing protein [Bacteroidota bacterium]